MVKLVPELGEENEITLDTKQGGGLLRRLAGTQNQLSGNAAPLHAR